MSFFVRDEDWKLTTLLAVRGKESAVRCCAVASRVTCDLRRLGCVGCVRGLLVERQRLSPPRRGIGTPLHRSAVATSLFLALLGLTRRRVPPVGQGGDELLELGCFELERCSRGGNLASTSSGRIHLSREVGDCSRQALKVAARALLEEHSEALTKLSVR